MINKNKNVIRYVTDPNLNQYAFDFPFFSKYEMKVLLAKADNTTKLLVLGVDYLVSKPSTTGVITIIKSIPSDFIKLTIYRYVEPLQKTDYKNGETLNADEIEKSFDRATAMIQQLTESMERSIKANISDLTPDLIIPIIEERKGKLLGFSSDGMGLKVVDGSNIPEIAKEVKKDSDIAVNAKDVAVAASLAAKRAFKINIGDGQNLIYTINHNLDTFDYIVAVWTNTEERRNVLPYCSKPDKNNLKLEFREVPGIDGFTVVITCVENSYTGIVDWVSITNKPAIFPSNWVSVAGKPELYNKTEINSSQGAQDTKINNNTTKINTLESKVGQELNDDSDVIFNTLKLSLPQSAKQEEGFYVFPSGLIIQWGFNDMSVDKIETIPFNTTFPNAVLAIYSSTAEVAGGHLTNVAYKNGASLSDFKLYARNGSDCYWFAIGY